MIWLTQAATQAPTRSRACCRFLFCTHQGANGLLHGVTHPSHDGKQATSCKLAAFGSPCRGSGGKDLIQWKS